MDENIPARLRALVVGDDPDGLAVLVKMLTLLNCDILGTRDPSSCIDLAIAGQPRLILLDLGMPAMDGFELLLRLRNAHLTPFLAVAVTGYRDASIVRRCQDAGFHYHELKPVPMERLRELTEKARRLNS